MTIFEQLIATYFISTAALAGAAVLWRNWLEDHPRWKAWLGGHLNGVSHALTCGSCFTYWLALVFVLIFNPLSFPLASMPPFEHLFLPISYLLQWMTIGWGASFLRFSYVFIQEKVSGLVHRH